MTPILQDDWLTVYGGDNREVLRTLPDESVQCVVSSPPYFGLRDYGTASWDGGDPECDHQPRAQSRATRPAGLMTGGKASVDAGTVQRDCHCGAIRQDRQLGLEQTPEEYVANMVDVFREVRRVLRKDGTLWLNLGDSYASGTIGRNDDESMPRPKGGHRVGTASPGRQGSRPRPDGMKPKDLVGIPWRVAFALQADGWYLRSDIIWAKPNPMPESVTDRPTKSHEYLFLLSKSATYHYDADAVREDALHAGRVVRASDPETAKNGQKGQYGATAAGFTQHDTIVAAGRNRRSVWTIATKPYPGAHFATFPEALVEPCILAGSSAAGACATCGSPWERVVEKGAPMDLSGVQHRGVGDDPTATLRNDVGGVVDRSNGQEWARWKAAHPDVTLGFRPTCAHAGDPVPCVVLDPFAGTGTVGVVAQRLSRRALLIDLNPDYLRQCLTRNQQSPLGLEVA
jgi:DNA modification methylase